MGTNHRVGLVGAGYVSTYHIRALQTLNNVEIVGITDLDQSKAQEVASKFQIPFAKDTKELYAAGATVVHVLTPPSSHCSVALDALRHGCHVFIEKPMAVTQEECDRIIKTATVEQRTVSVNHSMKFDPAVRKALALIEKNAIGDVVGVEYLRSSEYPAYQGGAIPTHYQDGGFPFRDLGVHGLYLLEAFLGEIQQIKTHSHTSGHHAHLALDDWHCIVHCRRGTGYIHLDWTSRPQKHCLQIIGTQGSILLDLYLETCVIRKTRPVPKAVEAIVNASWNSASYVGQVLRNSFAAATGKMVRSPDIHSGIREFYLALSVGDEPPISAEEGRRMVQILEAPAAAADLQKRERDRAAVPCKEARVLVTGANGFLGSALVKALLAQGTSLRILVRRSVQPELANHPSVGVVQGDLGDPDAVERATRGVEIVYHVGAATKGSWEEYECGTVWGTRNVVDSCLRNHARLIYVSSLSVLRYAGLPSGTRLDESAELEPYPEKRGYYANAKLQAERIVVDAIRKDGLRAVILRPGNIFGPGAEGTPPYGVFTIGNRWAAIGNGSTVLPLVYVEDVVDALLQAGASDAAAGRVLHLVDPGLITQNSYFEFVAANAPGISIHRVPRTVLFSAAVLLEWVGKLLRRSVPLTIYRLRSIQLHVEFDCHLAHSLLGWGPPVGAREGLVRTFGRVAPSVSIPLVVGAAKHAGNQ